MPDNMAAPVSIYDLAVRVLQTADPALKAQAAHDMSRLWLADPHIGEPEPLNDTPARPKHPICVPPKDVPRRRLGSPAGRGALLHAIAHIEFNAIDLAADMIARFGHHSHISGENREDFLTDWISVADDEARHFRLVIDRMAELGLSYGDLPAHNGLWDAALATKDSFAARLAIAPMVLEARGLDVTPAMIDKMRAAGDSASAAVLNTIYTEEVRHVAIGRKWFAVIAKFTTDSETELFHKVVKKYFKGPLKQPFNVDARDQAGIPRQFYLPLASI